MTNLRIIIAQLNFLVGDIAGNTAKIVSAIHAAKDQQQADLVLFPELALTAYPPEDLLLRPEFHNQVTQALQTITREAVGITAVVGYPHQTEMGLYNAAAVLQNGRQIANYYKQQLPNYGVFDERRYFTRGVESCVIPLKDAAIGILICEDLWFAEPTAKLRAAGAELILAINASPYCSTKHQKRLTILQNRNAECGLPIVYAHGVGAQDELVFDGGSLVYADGAIVAQAEFFHEQLLTVDFRHIGKRWQVIQQPIAPPLDLLASIYKALVLGLKDYVDKNRFKGVLLGLSGGIDSALTLAIAVDALGKERVRAVLLPSRYTSELSMQLGKEQAELLDVDYSIFSIEPAYTALLATLADEFANKPMGLAEENLQARCRGTLLMALSNQSGCLVLTTTNKSELAVGYGTLYGDMAGGFAVLKDVWKTRVFELSHYRNQLNLAIVPAIIERPPSAELAPNQKDEDSLPPYAILDAILSRYVEYEQSLAEIISAGFEEEVVQKVVALVGRSEYKRRQGPPGIKISRRAFGRERRYPMTSGFKPE